jgi:methionine-rich copper-binding protein CopC
MHPLLLCRIAALAALAWVVLPASPALAHAIIVEATPQVGAVVHAGAVEVRLRFNSRIDQRRSRLALLDAAGKETMLKLDDGAPVDAITARIPSLAPGDYRLRWQVLALDGHITRGDIPFSVTAP